MGEQIKMTVPAQQQLDGVFNCGSYHQSDSFQKHVEDAISRHALAISETLTSSDHAVCCIDGFLGEACCRAMRLEAEALRAAGKLEHVESSGDVRAVQVERGYADAPLLMDHAITITREIAAIINARCPEVALDASRHTNKVAVAEHTGSKYRRHIDNMGLSGDLRKLTAVYYLNPDYKRDHGGRFRAFDCRYARSTSAYEQLHAELVSAEVGVATFAPRGDRMLLFWSDALVHDVMPTFTMASTTHIRQLTETVRCKCFGPSHDPAMLTAGGFDDEPTALAVNKRHHRWAFTVWMVSHSPDAIRRGCSKERYQRHFQGPGPACMQCFKDVFKRTVTGTVH